MNEFIDMVRGLRRSYFGCLRQPAYYLIHTVFHPEFIVRVAFFDPAWYGTQVDGYVA